MPRSLRVYWNEATLAHGAPESSFRIHPPDLFAVHEPHPDRPGRIRNIRHAIEAAFPGARWTDAEPAPPDRLALVHDPDYVEWFREFCADGGGWVGDTGTGANRESYAAARHAAGAAIAAAERAVGGGDEVPYALCRPSGHHAQPDRADGFCFFNNVALGAEAAIEGGDADRVAIVDWDVHHGNGTQEAFYGRDDVLVVSLHNDHGAWHDHYHPQEGSTDEVGTGAGEGYTVNVPLPPGTGNGGYALAFEEVVAPVVGAFDPDLVLVSAGADPGAEDPLGRNTVTRPGFRDLGARARRLADRHAGGDLALVQEGGYQLTHLPIATLGALEGALGTEVDLSEYGIADDPFGAYDEYLPAVEDWVEDARTAHAAYWPLG